MKNMYDDMFLLYPLILDEFLVQVHSMSPTKQIKKTKFFLFFLTGKSKMSKPGACIRILNETSGKTTSSFELLGFVVATSLVFKFDDDDDVFGQLFIETSFIDDVELVF